jgi:alginate O-acetyltransferase complex protein AlgI
MITMMLGGLWHGASWSFLIWGGLHGFFLIINRLWAGFALQRRLEKLTGLARLAWLGLRVALTFNAVCLAWCFFRLTALHESLVCVHKTFVFDGGKMLAGGVADASLWILIFAYMLAAAAVSTLTRGLPIDAVVESVKTRPFLRGALWGCALSLLVVALLLARTGEKATFIYFQF